MPAGVGAAAPVRRGPSRRRRAERLQRRQARRRLRRLLWGGGLLLTLLASVAIGLLLQHRPVGGTTPPLAGTAVPATDPPANPATNPSANTGRPAPGATAAAQLGSPNARAAAAGPLPSAQPSIGGPPIDPTAALAQTVPTPVPLDRAARDPTAGARLAAAQAAAPTPVGAAAPGAAGADGRTPVTVVDANGRTGTAELRGASVSEADLGIRLAPGSQIDPNASSRVREPSGSETVMVVLSSSDTAERLAAHYRAQLQATAGGAAVQSYTPGPGQLLLQSVNPSTGVNRAVLIAPQGPGAVTVTLVRAQPAAGTSGP